MVDAARSIMAVHGAAGLYRGLSVTLLEIVPYAALQFGVYDALNVAVSAARRRAAAAEVRMLGRKRAAAAVHGHPGG
jgi:solute carrier family 25 thiamine pyrophosphate transporter 19